MQFNIPEDNESIIKVIGVGGGGSNAVAYMFEQGIIGVDFAISNTDNQAMNQSKIPVKIQLGPALTEGRGAGSKPAVGRESCIESLEEVKYFFQNNTKMLFVTAGMGGGTGTGAAPVIAKAARELDILTVAIVTMPFGFEGRRRAKQAQEGLEELKKNVDTLIVISNDKLRKIYGNLSLSEAFAQADNILTTAAKGIAEIITVPGYVNVDFEDVNTVMRDSGVAVMGTAVKDGENRALEAVESALESPLLEDSDIKGAKHILLNITSGARQVTMDEVFEITEYVQNEAGEGTDLIWGNCHDESLGDSLAVTVIATGFQSSLKENELRFKAEQVRKQEEPVKQPRKTIERISLDDAEDDGYSFLSKKKGIQELGSEKRPYSEHKKQEPFVKNEQKQQPRNMEPPYQLGDSEEIRRLENQPAYMRKGVRLEGKEKKENKESSNWSVDEHGRPEINERNSYLHDNVD
ncbi:cell division protein FtsZ [Saprospira grandis DSM 2844]|uniref:Cell division protein FtsZ n=1 Tax=Saprospira grandis DSM 2844 TaxID=694433 RepID=J0XYF5_9BACT|nr:cell division protein FtsZ [Saprospira grandis]EJF54151.1 cell division protein FtsZ [Saprospira grandis DSM 2844]